MLQIGTRSLTFPAFKLLARPRLIRILVKLLIGKTIHLSVDVFDTVLDIKEMIYDMKRIPEGVQILVYNGRKLEDDGTCFYYNIQNDSILHLEGALQIYYPLLSCWMFHSYRYCMGLTTVQLLPAGHLYDLSSPFKQIQDSVIIFVFLWRHIETLRCKHFSE